MKELESVFTHKDKMEISIQKKQQKEKELIGQIVPHNGHKIWEINHTTLEIKLAKFQPKPYVFGQKQMNPEIIVRNGYSYVSALSAKTALKKYKKGVNGGKKMDSDFKISIF